MIVPSFPRTSETFIVNKFVGLLEKGHDVSIICQASDSQEWARFAQLQAQPALRRSIRVSWPHRPRWLALALTPLSLVRCLMGNLAGTLRYLRLGWKRFGPDILRRLYLDADALLGKPDILHFEFGGLVVARLYLRELLDCKVVVSFRGYDLNYAGLDKPDYYQEVWDKADHLHLLGEDLWRRAQRRGCPATKPHTLIAPAIDAEFFDPGERAHTGVAGSAERPLRVLSVGRLEWKKAYEYALQAIRLLVDQGIHCEYRIIGDGEYIESVAFARHQYGLEDVVDLMGSHSRPEVKAQALWADVFLHTAVSEGFCNAVLEAQAMALPVVSSDADGLPENVVDGETGFVVSRRAPQALADKLQVLAQNPAARQQMGQQGRERVKRHFQLADQINAFDSMYHKIR